MSTSSFFSPIALNTNLSSLRTLITTANLFISHHLADNTRLSYQSAINSYQSFCTLFHIPFSFPVSDIYMCLYITYVATRTSPPPLQYSTIKNYSYGIQSYHSSEHQIEHWLSTLTLYHKCMKGIKRRREVQKTMIVRKIGRVRE